MKKITTRRRFHPYTSRKNMKRAMGAGKFSPPRTEDLGGMGTQLLDSMLGRAPQGDRG